MDADKVVEAVEAVYTGKLAKDIKNKSSYSLTGMMFGAIGGVLIAGFLGQNKLIFGLGGAAVAGLTGYFIAKK